MVALIWFLCCLGYGLVVTTLAQFGIRLGMIPTILLFGLTCFIAGKIVSKWKENRSIKSNRKYDALKQSTPPKIFEHCGQIMSDKQDLRSYLTACSNNGQISSQQANDLYHYFTKQINY